MASLAPISHYSGSIFFTNKTPFQTPLNHRHINSLSFMSDSGKYFIHKTGSVWFRYTRHVLPMRAASDNIPAMTAADQKKKMRKKATGFAEELRSTALRLHTKEQVKEGEKEVKAPHDRHLAKWEPTFEGYMRFLVDSKLVHDTLEGIIGNPAFLYSKFRNTGLERSEKLAKDLEWFKDQGQDLPEPTDLGVAYADYLKELSGKDSRAIVCNFCNIHFGLAAGGRMMGKKVSEKVLNNKELDFYKWDGDVSQLLQNVKDKLNKAAESWTREEKNKCLGEAEKSFKYNRDMIGLILSR